MYGATPYLAGSVQALFLNNKFVLLLLVLLLVGLNVLVLSKISFVASARRVNQDDRFADHFIRNTLLFAESSGGCDGEMENQAWMVHPDPLSGYSRYSNDCGARGHSGRATRLWG